MAALDCKGSPLAELMDLFACKETGGVSHPSLWHDIYGFRPV